MKNLEQWLADYLETSASRYFDLFFVFERKVYHVTLNTIKPNMVKFDHDSKSGADTLRMNIDKIRKAALLANFPCEYIGEDSILPRGEENKGDWCEKYMCVKHGQEWHKDSTAYYKQGDIKIGSVWHQVKFQNATLTKLETIEKALTLKG